MSKILNYFSLLRTIVSPLTAFFCRDCLGLLRLCPVNFNARLAYGGSFGFDFCRRYCSFPLLCRIYHCLADLQSNYQPGWAYSRFFDLYIPVFGIGSDALFFGQPGLLGHFAPVGRLLHGLMLYVFGKLAEHPGQQ